MNYLSADNISKTYGDQELFSGLQFGLQKGEKTALVANNGAGKSTLLKILIGRETPDTGQVTLRDGVKTAFLEQEPEFDGNLTVDELIASSHSAIFAVIRDYEHALHNHSVRNDPETQRNLEKATAEMDRSGAWDYDRRLKQLLTLFRITDRSKKTGILSGGDKKRLALAMVLLDDPELLIMDEPTNHLDIDMIEWLEKYLSRSNLTLLMVTHDRYFLDRICNHILELSQGKLYRHDGNYEYFIRKKAERNEKSQVESDKARQLMKKELEWLRRMPKARTHKSKSRIQAIDTLKDKAATPENEKNISLNISVSRMGGKILQLDHIYKSYGNTKILEDFSYHFKKRERIGIIGRNGSGKTSFLNVITGLEKPDRGNIDKGETIVFGYYRQTNPELHPGKKVIDVIAEIAEVIIMGDGTKVSASKFLEQFLFPSETQYKEISKLSGGEKQRLKLMTVLIRKPNFLILDEPTNDLDLLVLNKLEEFLAAYSGCLILVSHDRYFLDKLTDHLFVFEGDGRIRDFYGSYTDYRNRKEQEQRQKEKLQKKSTVGINKTMLPKVKTRLSYNEQREYTQLEKEIEELEAEKAEAENRIDSGETDYKELNRLSKRIAELIELIDQKTLRWIELDEYV